MAAIHITLKKSEQPLALCQSKWWGDPDMPEEMDYPAYFDKEGDLFPYVFICQINCEEIAQYDAKGLLPHKGMLYFFGKIDYYLGYDSDTKIPGVGIWKKKDVKVIYIEDVDLEKMQAKVLVNEDDEQTASKELEICFSNEKDKTKIGDVHQLLGEPSFMTWEDWDEPCAGWKLLLQVDTFEGDDFYLLLMDMGVLYFLISEEDLKQRNFSEVRAAMTST